MWRVLSGVVVAVLLIAGMAGCAPSERDEGSSAAGGTAARPERLRIGWTPNDEDVERRVKWDGLRMYLERKLGMPVELVQTATYSPAIEAMRARKLDVAGLAPFAYLIAHEKTGAEPLVVPGFPSGEASTYRSVFITHPGTGLTSMEDVKAHSRELTLAWADPASASGHLVPRAHLESIGLFAERDFRRVIFSLNHTASIMSIKAGKLDLAAVTLTSLNNLVEKGRVSRESFRVLWTSEPIMASMIAVRGGLPEEFKRELREAYLSFRHEAPEAWAKIAPLYLTTGVVWVPASDADFASLRALARNVKGLRLLD
jgi:phosphonate transport system substrate-binding protein